MLYPLEPSAFRRLLEVLGEPSEVELEIVVRDERLKEFLGMGDVKYLSVRCRTRLGIEDVVKLYEEYYMNRVDISGSHPGSRIVTLFKAFWYLSGSIVTFDGFELRIRSYGGVEKLLEVLKLFSDRNMDIVIEVSSREPKP